MWKVTWKGLLAHKLRFLLTGLSIVLGIAFLAGTLVLVATIDKTFDDLFTEIFEGTDVQVRGTEPFESDFFPQRLPVDEAVLERVRQVDGVEVASPSVEVPYAQIVNEEGDEIGNLGAGPPLFGFSYEENEDLNPFRIEDGGHTPENDNEVVIDKRSADDGDIEVGEPVSILTRAGAGEYTVVGIARFGSADSPGGASVTQFTLEEAQQINGFTPEQFSNIGVVGESGISQDELRDRIASVAGSADVEVITGQELTEENQDQIQEFVDVINWVLLVFAAVSLLVGMFIIYNTFNIIMAQRTREMALLRAIGAGARQVTISVVAEAVAIGIVAAALGFGLGVALASGLKAVLDAFGLDIPAESIVIPTYVPIVSLIVGVVVTVLSALVPARRASRVPPVAAIREVAIEQAARLGARTAIGTAILALGAIALLFGLFAKPDNVIAFVGPGVLAIFAGVVVLGPLIATPVARVLGAPLPRLRGMAGTLARENAIRNPRRTAATASALMIGVALVGFITIFAASTKESFGAAIDEQLRTDFIVSAGGQFGFGGLSPEVAEQMKELPELGAVSAFRWSDFAVNGDGEFVSALEPDTADELFDFNVQEGSIGDLAGDATTAVSKSYADDNDLGIGDTVTGTFPLSGPAPLQVVAIYERDEIAGAFLISLQEFERLFLPQNQIDSLVVSRLVDGADPEAARADIEQIVEPYPIAEVQDNTEYKEDQQAQIDQVVNLVYVLLFLAVFIALIGIANTLALSIHERTREIGLLRAVGMTRGQVRETVRWESVIIALFGTAMGLVVGLFFGWAVVTALRDEGFSRFAIAPGQLTVVVIVAAIAGIGAAVGPARRASRLDVLQAIATE